MPPLIAYAYEVHFGDHEYSNDVRHISQSSFFREDLTPSRHVRPRGNKRITETGLAPQEAVSAQTAVLEMG